jgi:hypothetical protein
MKSLVRTSLILTGLLLASAAGAQGPQQQPAGLSVVELFQSQGCSSCPPAIANVNALAGRSDVLPLIFAVDYWDNLGWKDTFAKHAYTQRQQAYAHGLHNSGVATPQVVVNGRKDLVGGDAKALAAAIATTPRPQIPVTLTASSVTVGEGLAPIAPADVWLVRYDPRTINVAIKAGENNGKTLAHRDVVKEMTRLGHWNGKAASYPVPAPGDPALKTAILVQPPGGPILAATG